MQTASAATSLGTFGILPHDRYVLFPTHRSSHYGRLRGISPHEQTHKRIRRSGTKSSAILRPKVCEEKFPRILPDRVF